MSEDKKKVISQEDIMKLLDACYEKCLNGVPHVSPSVEEMANDYLSKYKTKEIACKAMPQAAGRSKSVFVPSVL